MARGICPVINPNYPVSDIDRLATRIVTKIHDVRNYKGTATTNLHPNTTARHRRPNFQYSQSPKSR